MRRSMIEDDGEVRLNQANQVASGVRHSIRRERSPVHEACQFSLFEASFHPMASVTAPLRDNKAPQKTGATWEDK